MEKSISQMLEDLQFQYEHCTPDSIAELLKFYAPSAIFKDPFQEVVGHVEIEKIFTKMFVQLNNPRFIVQEKLIGQDQACLLWDFEFSMKRWNTSKQSFRGVSWLYFDQDQLIQKHHDYWDPASGIYEQLPILGPIMRGLKSLA